MMSFFFFFLKQFGMLGSLGEDPGEDGQVPCMLSRETEIFSEGHLLLAQS